MEEYFILPPLKVTIITSPHLLIQRIHISLSPLAHRCLHYISSPVGEQAFIFFQGYLKKTPLPMKLPLEWERVSPFTRKVLCVLQKNVPFGQWISYSSLAHLLGSKKAARAVGNALGANPWPIIIPCHRVLRKDKHIGGFSAGVEVKRFLLKHEGIYFRD